ncbi:potassium-transporting ATPase subunit KdpC [Uliginosibacterium sp. H3]|uniref:Potassium-transporting ATPase KdpC subunit n=1 Tax=Uliginosibacterium silvisoli TaxID=3114758 RepID=A0ABU6K8M5_9RHOO|nr:potassium-transporting ATPase subunit KdpC [Uliginosibacterium sp. H3]
MKSILRPALVLFALLTVLTGFIYPLAVTGVAQVAFPQQAHGSLVMRDGKAVGSELIGQAFSDPKYFWGRPSATGPMPNNGAASGGSNQAPSNPALIAAVKDRVEALRAADPGNTAVVPQELVTTSASGLDPEISPAAARYQASRIARVRGVSEAEVGVLVERNTQGRTLGFIGEPRVNVLALNMALDGMVK